LLAFERFRKSCLVKSRAAKISDAAVTLLQQGTFARAPESRKPRQFRLQIGSCVECLGNCNKKRGDIVTALATFETIFIF